ncbi:response regulator [Mucilaginibacter sp. KACC 22063]|uniref:response regulator n=1 Tax=Mucilaginibacter sp. KACC 22063 TaxID=3025666 RepID=UPI002364FF16|nr:response regulator [Mucilaginibacter sp. KACC 22063]WDF53928.1 response regulator [Mucilaginibacter sp. KACC 22063]
MKKKILICDDDEGILEMLEMVLDGDGYEVLTVKNSLKIFDCIKQEHPDMLILDLWMPVLSGDQIAIKLRSTPDYKNLPIMIMSASRDGEEIAKAVSASSYLSKPFDLTDFLVEVEKLSA